MIRFVLYLLTGIFFGIVLVKSQVVSWFRIQEMFYLESFHMYGVFASAVATAAISYRLLRLARVRSLRGDEIKAGPKEYNKGIIIGGFLFGLGWAITGSCPGPIYALVGSGYAPMAVTLVFAIAGTWLYGALRSRLPH